MRAIIQHDKSREAATRAVEKAVDGLLGSEVQPPFRVAPVNKRWNGSTMDFDTSVSMGFFSAPVRGNIEVGGTQIVVEIQLPSLLARFVPENDLRQAVERGIRKQLNQPSGA